MCSWVGEESGRYLYKYDLDSGEYLGKVHMQAPPQWLQGIAYHDGCFYMTADDGTADDDEPDHLYRTRIEEGATNCTVTLERTFDDVTRQGEIEGLTFDEENGQLLLLYNRGARIVLGMPKGFYDGYDREIAAYIGYERPGFGCYGYIMNELMERDMFPRLRFIKSPFRLSKYDSKEQALEAVTGSFQYGLTKEQENMIAEYCEEHLLLHEEEDRSYWRFDHSEMSTMAHIMWEVKTQG